MKPKRAFERVHYEGGESMKRYAGLTYEQAVQNYADSVTKVCSVHLDNTADAEDCFQNTFIKLYTKSPEFRDEEHLKAWLLRVAINECKSCVRENKRKNNAPLPKIPAPSTEDACDISWALTLVEFKYRRVLYLYYCERYKVDEIASILGKNTNTVKTMLSRGRDRLRKIYGGDER